MSAGRYDDATYLEMEFWCAWPGEAPPSCSAKRDYREVIADAKTLARSLLRVMAPGPQRQSSLDHLRQATQMAVADIAHPGRRQP